MLIGHEKLVDDFKSLADRNELAHGYIFFGPPRVGKKLFAFHLANYLETGFFGEPKILSDTFFIGPISPMGPIGPIGSIGIDQARQIKNFLWQKPNASKYRTVIIDDAQFLTNEAQNSLLKIVEEPPASGFFIFIIDDPERLWLTLQSRLQKVYFSKVPVEQIKNWLEKELSCGPREAGELAERSLGQPGLAWAILKDENFQKLQKTCREFLRLPTSRFRDFLKTLLADEDFRAADFLDVLIMETAGRFRKTFGKSSQSAFGERERKFWHQLLKLRRDIDYFNLNPRLQLENLARSLQN